MKVQNEMSTRISVDAVSAIGSMSAFRNAISSASSAWRAQETALKNSGNYTEAATTRLRGLNQVIDLQKAKVEELRQRQEGLDTSNEKQANQFLKLERQIQSANRQLASYASQATRAKNAAQYQVSGLAQLQHQMHLTDDANRSYVASLRAQGKVVEANKAEMSGLRTSLSSLEKQQTKQRFLLKQVEQQSGKTSDAYKQQQIQLNKTGEAIGKTQSQMKELDKSLNPPHTTAWTFFRNNILQVDSAEKKARDSALNFGSVLKANVFGGWIQQGFSTMTTGLKSMITNGMQAAKVGAAMEARWKNIGMSAAGVKQLSAQVADLKTNSYLSAQSVNALQTRFYAMTGSVKQAKTLTQGVASLTDQLKLSEGQANGFASGLSRIESSGKVTSSSLGRLEKQAPGLTAAMAKAAGMSKKSFQQLVASGKMTTAQFNQLLARTSQDYGKNAKAFRSTSGGAMHALRQDWIRTQAQLAKPLLKVSATGLNELQKALDNKDTQRGLKLLAKGLADAAVQAAKFIGYIAKHQTTVKVFGASILGLAVAFKGMQTAVVAADTIKKFGKLMAGAKAVRAYSIATRGLGLAFRFMTGPIGIVITAISAVVIALNELYKHNKKFRNFVNGLGRDAKNGMSKVGHWFSNTFKGIKKQHEQNVKQQQRQNKAAQRNWDNFSRSVSHGSSNLWRTLSRNTSNGVKTAQRSWHNMNKTVGRVASNMWRSLSRNAVNGWKTVQRAAQNGSSRVSNWYQRMNRDTSRVLQDMARQHPHTFGNMYKFIEDRSKTWHDITSGHWSRLGSDTKDLANDMYRFHQHLFGDMYDKLNDLTSGGLDKIRETWNKVLNSIHDAVVHIGHTIHKAWDDLLNGLIDVFGGLINGIIKGINWVIDHVGGSGHLGLIKLSHFANGSNGSISKRQMAVLNDAPDSDYREMVHKHATGKTFMLPAKRNIVMPLEPGDEVLNGKKTAQMMSLMGLPHYAHGSIGSFFSGIFDKVGDAIDGATDWVEKALKNVVEFGKELFRHFTRAVSPKTTDYLGTHLKDSLPGFFATSLKSWLKKQLDQLNTADPPGTGVTRWRPLVLRALHMLGLSSSLVNKVLRQIQTESSGNPKAMGGTDGLADGHAMGLMQVKPGTFNAYKLPGHNNIWNGFDNLLAGLNYAKHRYGSDLSYLGQGHGYANGGYVTQHGIYEMAEGNNPEVVIPLDGSKRGHAYSLLMSVLSQFKREDGTAGDGADSQQLSIMNRKFDAVLSQNQQLIGLLDKLIGVTDSANNPTARYKRTQHDINLAHAQSLI